LKVVFNLVSVMRFAFLKTNFFVINRIQLLKCRGLSSKSDTIHTNILKNRPQFLDTLVGQQL